MGTVKLLFKCKNVGSLSNISDKLGDYVRTNSEAILAVRSSKIEETKDFNKGIAISAGFSPDDKTYIETCRYGKGQNSMSLLTTHLFTRKGFFLGVLHFLWNFICHPI